MKTTFLLLTAAFIIVSYKTIAHSYSATILSPLKAIDPSDSSIQSPQRTNPCTEAKTATEKATKLSVDSNYRLAYTKIQHAAVDNSEHCISFGRDTFGNIIMSDVSSGNEHSTNSKQIINRFADIHNHTGDLPPSSGDLYGLIDLAKTNVRFESRYIITRNRAVYALVIINLQRALEFNANYSRVNHSIYQPGFPEAIVDEFNKLKGWGGISDEMAMAFILEKYHTGIAVLKQDKNGHFKRLNTILTIDANGIKKYSANNCE